MKKEPCKTASFIFRTIYLAAPSSASLPCACNKHISRLAANLCFEYHAHSANLSAQRRCEFRYATLNLYNLRKMAFNGLDDVHRHTLNGALCNAHLFANNLIDCQIIHSLLHRIFFGHTAQMRGDFQLDAETISHLLLQIVAAVKGAEFHLFEFDCVKHSS